MRRRRSISFPIVSASISVGLAISLLIGWTLVIVQNISLTQQVTQNVTVLVLGILSFVTIIVFVILFSIFLVRRNREINRQYNFIDSVTHELKTPLASLRLAVETQERGELPEEMQQELRSMMKADIARLNLFIDDILVASRLGESNASFEMTEFDIVPLVGEIRDILLSRHNLQPDRLVVATSPCPFVVSERTGLGTVLTNVLENAVKYSRQENGGVPPIEIDVEPTERWVKIAITDQGIGIDKKFQKRVFRRFFRVPTEEVQRRHGSGLGLFVVSELCRSLKARIEIQSPESGRGTTVVILVPASQLAVQESAIGRRTEPT